MPGFITKHLPQLRSFRLCILSQIYRNFIHTYRHMYVHMYIYIYIHNFVYIVMYNTIDATYADQLHRMPHPADCLIAQERISKDLIPPLIAWITSLFLNKQYTDDFEIIYTNTWHIVILSALKSEICITVRNRVSITKFQSATLCRKTKLLTERRMK